MTPSQLVPDLETCKALVKAGWTKSTYFLWVQFRDKSWHLLNPTQINALQGDFIDECYAMTLSEILEELPKEITHERETYYLCYVFEPLTEKFVWGYQTTWGDQWMWIDSERFVYSDSPSALYLKLKEEKLM